ncbi:hypothetical protein IKF33_00555 [Candidatus Saccharibacteria bacterium]|nr:hypothetical protein [Candidatus Saccharibacteria bacterium]
MTDKKNDKKPGMSTDAAVILGAIGGALLFVVMGGFLFLATGLFNIHKGEIDFARLAGISKFIEQISDTKEGTSISLGEPQLVDNPNPRVWAAGRLIEIKNLEFSLPYAFSPAMSNGQNGIYVYNLTNDDGWADVRVYVNKSYLSAERYMLSLSSTLEVVDDDYEVSGTSWIKAENGSMVGYATKFDDEVYVIIYGVKLDSDTTDRAMEMLPETLRMKKIYQ